MRPSVAPSRLMLALITAHLACGGDSQPASPAGSVPEVAGTYSASTMWTLQVLRKSDGFQKSFTCSGSLTLSQAPTTTTVAGISGFLVVGSPCEPVSFPLTGTVQQGGAVAFTSDGPRPTEGPCPGGRGMSFSGQITGRQISARATTTVQCPDYGEHAFTYILNAYRNN